MSREMRGRVGEIRADDLLGGMHKERLDHDSNSAKQDFAPIFGSEAVVARCAERRRRQPSH